MKKKTIGILLVISLVMLISVGAISAADTNDTLLEKASDTNIATASVALEDNATSHESDAGSDVEKISVNDNEDEISTQKVGSASSDVNDVVLSAAAASNDDLLKASSGSFRYNGIWYDDLDDAVDEACDNNGGTIYIRSGTYGSDSDDVKIKISDGVSITFEPLNSGDKVIFDGSKNDKWFFAIADTNARVTFKDITFRNGGAFQGGAIEVDEGELNLQNCIFEGNKAFTNLAGGYGWGGAIYLDDDSCTLVARNCRFINNNAASGGGAVCVEGDGSNAEFINCYFEGNKQGDDENDVYDKDSGTHSFSNCSFIGHGSIEYTVNYLDKSVEITPVVEDEVNYLALYHYGEFYDGIDCISGSTKTFTDLELGSYTIYMKYYDQKRYIYKDVSFRIVANDFILNDNQPFASLSAAVNAIPDGGSGVITVNGGIYTESENFNVKIENNKNVTIRPKEDSLEDVIFSANSRVSTLLDISAGCYLTMEDITMTGDFINALFFKNADGTISNCEFKNILGDERIARHPISIWYSNVVLNDCTFESNSNIVCRQSTLNVTDCTFTNNSDYYGGAIADTFYLSNLTVTGSKFIGNDALRQGGAIIAGNLKIHDTEFIGNSAETGGAIYIGNANSIINITGSVFDSNTGNYRNIYSESLTREINLEHNEYDLNLDIIKKDGSYGLEYVLDGIFDWGSNLNNNYTVLAGVADNETIFGDLLTIEDNKFKINMGVLSAGTHEFLMPGMYYQSDRLDYFWGSYYYADLYENEFYLNDAAYAKILIDKAKITLTLEVKDVLIPETPVLNVDADWDLNYTIFIGNKYYQLEVVNRKASMQLTGLGLGNYTVVAMRDADENFELAMNFTTFSISKTYSNFLVLSTNVEYDTLNEAVANSNYEDTIYVKKGTYSDTGIVISNRTLDIIALEGAVFDAQGRDANFIIVNNNAAVDIWGITFRGLHNRNTNYGAIVNHGSLSLYACNFTDNKITKISFAENGGAAIFSDGYSLEIENCSFINNSAPLKVSTAAVTSTGYEDVSITSSNFINNSAREGGALHFKNISQFEPAIFSCNFEQNTAVKGSAIYVGNNSRYLSVTSSSFKKNDIKNSLGENAQLEGGVIYVNANASEVVLDIDASNFENNSNSNVDGGVICLDGISKAYIASSIFTNNSGKVGSAILIKNPYDKKLSLFVDGSIFIDNHAATGAIATSPKVTAFFDECIFANNTGENRNIYSNGFTVVHDSILDVNDAKLNAPSVQYGESSTITGTADIGTNTYATANLTVAGENVIVDIKNNTFTYNAGILGHGKYYAVLNSISDSNNNTYLVDGITEIFRVYRNAIEFNVSVDNITYGETLKVVESLPSNATGTLDYKLNGRIYTKDELESLILDAGKYTLVAIYDHDDFAFTSATVNFEVYKANPTISVPNVEVEYNDSIVLNIESDVASIYIIEIEDYNNAVFVNGSRTIVIDKTLNPGNYTIKVTSQERVNYMSNSTEAILNVNENLPVFGLRISNTNMDDMATDNTGEIDSVVDDSSNVREQPLMAIRYFAIANTESNENLGNSPDNDIGDENDEYKFMYQYDEDDDYSYFDTLEDAVDEAVLYGAGIITVRGGTYSVYSMDIEGEVELTIRAYGDEEVIFDCGGEDYFMLLTYDTEMYPTTTPPYFEVEQTDGPTVTLENITVIRGVATYGGAIDLEAGTLILNNCNFRNNAADEGGAIYIGKWDAENDATLIAVNTTFINNYASSEGGAIYIASDNLDGQTTSASFMLCTFLDNYQGEDNEKVRNYFAGGNVEGITSQYCLFNGNGEIYNFTIDKINQTVYVNGTSADSFDSVVLLYFDQAPLYTIYNNGSRDFSVTFEDVMGGNYTLGVMNDHKFNTYIFDVKFEMKVPNFIISEDEVYENLTDAIDAVAENGVIYANVNYYYEDNMEIDIRKSFTLKNFRDDGVVFDGNITQWFFTIAEGCTVVFEGIYFTDGAVKNHASIENYGTLIINNCTFESFETGEIIHNTGLLNILNSTFSLNSVNNAIVWNDADLFINATEFSYNMVNISSVVYTNGVAEIISSNFTGNYNFGNGGAIHNAKLLIVNGTVFSENEGIDGGAIYSTGTLEVLNSTFEDNTANGYGGAIYNGNEASIFNSTFTGSSSEKDGGAIYNNNIMDVDNSTFVGNTATGRGGAIYNSRSLVLTKSLFGINFAEEYANIYNAGDIQFSENIFDFYDVILIIPDGEYGIPTTITGTLNPEFNMDLQVVLPGFFNHEDAAATISEGVFEYTTADNLPKGIYDVVLNEVIYDGYGNIYYGQSIADRLIIHKANVYINVTVDDIVLKNSTQTPVLKISASKDGLFHVLFNNKLSEVNITGGQVTLTLDAVGEGNYSVMVVREGDENYNNAANTTTFTVTEYEGNFIVNSTGNKFDTLREAIADSSNDDVIYVMEGNYSGADNLGLTISNRKLSIISLGDVVFDGNSSAFHFLTVERDADVTICDVVFTGFKTEHEFMFPYHIGTFENYGILTLDGCIFANNTDGDGIEAFIYNKGTLNVVESGFYDNTLANVGIISSMSQSKLIVNESTFENNTLKYDLISMRGANSVKIISSVFAENKISSQFNIIQAENCKDILISSEFYNNTMGSVIYADSNSNVLVNNSIFTGNDADKIIFSAENTKNTISGCVFAENAVENVVMSMDQNLSVLESTFSDNTLSDYGALYIGSQVNATVNGSVFTNNKADEYRNIYSNQGTVDVSNSVFDALNVDYTVHDIDYGQNETIEGSIDIGTNFNFTVNLDINSNSYSVNVTDNNFTYNTGILNGGDYTVVLNGKDANSNTYVFDKITKIFAVSRVNPGLSVSIENITQGEKLKVNSTIDKKAKGNVVYELNGNVYSKAQLENLTLNHGNYLVTAIYRGDKNFLPVTVMANVEVRKITPNITVSDVVANYGDEIKINVTVDVADYYTVFLGNESLSLYVEDNATFTFRSADFKTGSYEIVVYVFESDDYAEAYANATLTVNKGDIVISAEDVSVTYGVAGDLVAVVSDVNGDPVVVNLTVNFNGEDYDLVTDASGQASLPIGVLTPGNYSAVVSFAGDELYVASNATAAVVVNMGDVVISAEDVSVTYGDAGELVAVVTDVNGDPVVANLTVNFNGEDYDLETDANGQVSMPIGVLTPGNYTAIISFAGDELYVASNATVNVVVNKGNVVISAEDVSVTYGDAGELVAVVTDVNGDPVVANLTVNFNGEDYDLETDANGQVSMPIGVLTPGNYTAIISFAGDELYVASNATVNVVVNKGNVVISAEDVYMTYKGDDAELVAVVTDVNGEPIAANLTVNFNNLETDANGQVSMPIGVLTPGNYTAVISFAGDELYVASNTTVNVVVNKGDVVISAEDVSVTYKGDAGELVAVVTDVNGNPVVANLTVNFNGEDYDLETDANGQVSMPIGVLTPGNYTATVSFAGDDLYVASNATAVVVVNKGATFISASDVTVKVGNVDGKLVAVLKDANGDAISGAKIKIAITNKVTKYISTDSNGQVSLSLSNLDIGTYNATITFFETELYNKSATTAKVSIRDMMNTTLTASDVVVICNNSGYLVATLKDTEGNAISGAKLKIVVPNKVTKYISTDANGQVLWDASNLDIGTYTATITFVATELYNKSTTTAKIFVVDKMNTTLTASDVVVIYKNSGNLVAVLKDANGDAISGAKIKIAIPNKVTKYISTDANGQVSWNASNLDIGNYTATITFVATELYNKATATAKVSVVEKMDATLTASDVVVICNNPGYLVAVLKDANGNAISGAKIKIAIPNKVTKYMYTDDNGQVSWDASNLDIGNYTAAITFLGTELYNKATTTAKVSVVEKMDATLTARDVVVICNNSGNLVAVLKDANGNAISGAKIKIAIPNKVTKYMYTDDNGQVSWDASNLDIGNYTATITFLETELYNKATAVAKVSVVEKMDTTLTAPNVVAGYNDGSKLVATLTDANNDVISDAKVKIVLNNITKYIRTDSNGQVALSLNNLNPGSYKAAITFVATELYNKSTVTAKVTIN